MKTRTIIAIAAALALLLFSCRQLPVCGPQNLTVVRVAIRGHKSLVWFKELRGEFVMPTDTLKKGDQVTVYFRNCK